MGNWVLLSIDGVSIRELVDISLQKWLLYWKRQLPMYLVKCSVYLKPVSSSSGVRFGSFRYGDEETSLISRYHILYYLITFQSEYFSYKVTSIVMGQDFSCTLNK